MFVLSLYVRLHVGPNESLHVGPKSPQLSLHISPKSIVKLTCWP